MFISYAILTHNEGSYVQYLLGLLTSFISDHQEYEQEIVILDDNSTDAKTQMVLRYFPDVFPFVKLSHKKHTGDFSEQKNALIEKCSGEWILNLDADEWVTNDFLSYIPSLIESNPDVEAFSLPRINLVDGITLNHVSKWGFKITHFPDFKRIKEVSQEELDLLKTYNLVIATEGKAVEYFEPVIQWPDRQMRLFKNIPSIRWTKKVHEQLAGYKLYGTLPENLIFAIRHFKDIKRQEKQNDMYESINKGAL